MTIQKTSKIRAIPKAGTEQFSYAKSLALSLILYAKHDEIFRRSFGKIAASFLPRERSKVFYEVSGIQVLLPRDRALALRRASWLEKRLQERSLPEFQETAEMLGNWEQIRIIEQPKSIVVGFIQVAIPGITLGRFKRFSKMTCLVSNAMAKTKAIELAKHTLQASIQLIADAVRAGNYNINKLEPEVADWFFGDRIIEFYKAGPEKMLSVKKELQRLGIPHSTVEKDDSLSLLAISPAANSEIEEAYWNLDHLEE